MDERRESKAGRERLLIRVRLRGMMDGWRTARVGEGKRESSCRLWDGSRCHMSNGGFFGPGSSS